MNLHASSTPLTSTTQKPKTTLSNEELDRKFKRELLRRMEEILTVLLEVKEKQNRMYADHCEKAIASVDSDSNPPVTSESERKELNTAVSKVRVLHNHSIDDILLICSFRIFSDHSVNVQRHFSQENRELHQILDLAICKET